MKGFIAAALSATLVLAALPATAQDYQGQYRQHDDRGRDWGRRQNQGVPYAVPAPYVPSVQPVPYMQQVPYGGGPVDRGFHHRHFRRHWRRD